MVLRVCSLGRGDSTTDGGNDVSRLIVIGGGAGAGKSRVTNSIFTSLKRQLHWKDANMLVTATTGKAATVINGCTVFS